MKKRPHAEARRTQRGRKGEELLFDRFSLKKKNLESNTINQRTTTPSLFLRASAPPRLCVIKWGIGLFLLFLFLFLSCQTAPTVTEQTLLESGVVPLNEGASAYALVDVQKARPILEKISYIPANDKNMKLMLDKTQTAAVAVYLPSAEDARRFHLVSWGGYPSGSGIAFGTSKDWKKQRSAKSSYWHSEKSQMSVVVTPSQAYVLAAMTKTPYDPIPHPEGIKIPDGLGEFGKDAVLTCWFSDPRSILNQKLRESGIPLEIPAEQLFICLFPADGQASASQSVYEAHIKIYVPGASQARAVATFIALGRAFMAPPARQPIAPNEGEKDGAVQNGGAMLSYILFANPVVQEDNSLILKLPPLSADDISLLFSMFSL